MHKDSINIKMWKMLNTLGYSDNEMIISTNDIEIRKAISPVLRLMNPTYSYCANCGIPWNWCNSKSVKISIKSGMFATCDVCWSQSTLGELRYYYTRVYKEWEVDSIKNNWELKESLPHILECVEKEYYNES